MWKTQRWTDLKMSLMFHLLIHCSKCPQQPRLVRPEAGPGKQACPAGGRDLTMGAVTCCFPGASPGSRIGREAEASPGTQIQRRGLLSSVFTSPGSRIRRETEMSPRHWSFNWEMKKCSALPATSLIQTKCRLCDSWSSSILFPVCCIIITSWLVD